MKLHVARLNPQTRTNLKKMSGIGASGVKFAASRVGLGSIAIATLLLLGLPTRAMAARDDNRPGMPISAAVLDADEPGQSTVASGTYLFGEAEQPNQIGREYMIFQVNQGRMVGAFFQPRSDFSCFTGNIKDEVMTLAVEDAVTQTTANISVQLYLSNRVAADSEMLLPFESALGLQGTYRIPEIDRTSKVVLETCKADLGF